MLTMLPSLCLISSKQTVLFQRRRSDGRAPGRAGTGRILGFCAFAANRSPAWPVIRLWRPGFTGPGRAGFKSWPFCTEQLHSACRVVLHPSNINNNRATLRLCVKSQGGPELHVTQRNFTKFVVIFVTYKLTTIQTCHTSSCRVEPLLVLPVSNLRLVTPTFFEYKNNWRTNTVNFIVRLEILVTKSRKNS